MITVENGTRMEIFDLLTILSQGLDILEVIGSCFAEGDISHIKDDELLENLKTLLEVNQERDARINV